jgi:hypothetical protein
LNYGLNLACGIDDEWRVCRRELNRDNLRGWRRGVYIPRRKHAASPVTFLRWQPVCRSDCDDACRGDDRKNHEPMQRQDVPILPCFDRDSRRLGRRQVSTRYFNSQFLLPRGTDFEKAAASIYVAVKYNRKKQPISDFMPENIADWHSRARDAKITDLDDLPRGDGKVAFVRHRFEAGSLHKQGYELQAVTTDSDNDGNAFLVTITLSANSRKALNAAEPAYMAILGKY